jgi:hypothetical protein
MNPQPHRDFLQCKKEYHILEIEYGILSKKSTLIDN